MKRMMFVAFFFSAALIIYSHSHNFVWASFAVERSKFYLEGDVYSTDPVFDGIGEMYVSFDRMLIRFKGIRYISIPYLGQDDDDLFEFYSEEFIILNFISINNSEYAFTGKSSRFFEREITGKIVMNSEARRIGEVDFFILEEHGRTYKGIMTRYSLPKTSESKVLFNKYQEIYFGGNFVLLK